MAQAPPQTDFQNYRSIYAAFFLLIFSLYLRKPKTQRLFLSIIIFVVQEQLTIVVMALLSPQDPPPVLKEASICYWYTPPSYMVILVIPFSWQQIRTGIVGSPACAAVKDSFIVMGAFSSAGFLQIALRHTSRLVVAVSPAAAG